jgi:hypothetical protein
MPIQGMSFGAILLGLSVLFTLIAFVRESGEDARFEGDKGDL